MKIVIAGAGSMGFHLAQLLSYEKQDITLIDTNQDVLDYAQSHLDVLVIQGDSSSVEILKNADIQKAQLFLAVTASEKNNLISAIIAKNLGVKQTIARVKNLEYLEPIQREHFSNLGIDHMISPIQLASQEIERLVRHCEVTDNFEFEGGKLNLNGITIDNSSNWAGQSLEAISKLSRKDVFYPIAILRADQTILPRPNTIIQDRDHIYFMSQKDKLNELVELLGKELVKVKNIMIIGGTELGLQTAKLLEHKYNVTLVEKNRETCRRFVAQLDNTLVVKGDPSNIELLLEEGLTEMDAFIALTPNSETNILTSLMAEHNGVYKTIALVDNTAYTHISQNIGVDTLINKKLIAANNIFRFVRKGKIEAIATPHGVRAEIIEFVVQKSNRLTKKPLRELRFPENSLIGGVIRGEETIIPTGEFQLQIQDKVIIFTMPESIGKVEKLFR
jgi:trk system potassium uptake protein TrkA